MKDKTTTPKPNYPYLPKNGYIKYVSADDIYMQEAKNHAATHSLDKTMPNSSIIVKDGKIIGRGANGSTFHDNNECERIKQNIPTGQGYELCEGCHPKNHGEPNAIADALKHNNSLKDAELYLWGHWWCCKPCWDAMLDAGINTVYLLENSATLFNKDATGNIVGKQFA